MWGSRPQTPPSKSADKTRLLRPGGLDCISFRFSMLALIADLLVCCRQTCCACVRTSAHAYNAALHNHTHTVA